MMKCLTLASALLLVGCQPMLAQPSAVCAPRAQVLERLSERYGETRQAVGLGVENVLIEVFASLDTGSWTITATLPSGTTCLIASGQAYEALSAPRPTSGRRV